MQTSYFTVKNIHCASCVRTIELGLKPYSAITFAKVFLVASKVQITWDTKILSYKDIEKILTDLGYPAEYITHNDILQLRREDKQLEQELETQYKKLFYFLILTVPLVIFAMATMHLPKEIQSVKLFAVFTTVQILLVFPIILFSYNTYISGYIALIKKQPTMDTLIALGTFTAFIYSLGRSVFIFMGDQQSYYDLYFESAGVILTLVLLGDYLEKRAKHSGAKALYTLASLAPNTATQLFPSGEIKTTPVKNLTIGDTIIVQQGMNVPIDGTIIKGEGSVNEAMLTGESLPIYKTIGATLYAGTILEEGTCTLHVDAEPTNTYLYKLISIVQEAQNSKAPIARIADIASAYFVPIVIIIAFTAGLLWLLATQNLSLSLQIFISSIIIACPCAMGLATPMSLIVGMGKASQLGIIIKNATALESTTKIDTVFFDKTGTITIGSPSVTALHIIDSSVSENDILDYIACITPYSTHPITVSLATIVEGRKHIYTTSDFVYTIGKGTAITASTAKEKYSILLGSKSFIDENTISYQDSIVQDSLKKLSEQGASPLFLSRNGQLIAIIAMRDTIRSDAKKTIKALMSKGIEVIMLSGDIKSTAEAIAHEVGIKTVYAELLPEGKVEVIKEYKAKKKHTMMVGDGINDAIALSVADIGVSMGAGIDIAQEASAVVLMNNELYGVYTTIMLTKATITNIKENLFWAFIYNIVAIPVATGILYIFGGPLLSPMIAGFAMVFSSLSVVGNAMRLKRFKIS